MQPSVPTAGCKLSEVPQHSYFQFQDCQHRKIFFSSRFDSGNMKQVARNSEDHYSIWTAADGEGTPYQGYPKSWFYFEAGGFRRRKISFSLHRVHYLWAMSGKKDGYRPVYRVREEGEDGKAVASEWRRLEHPIQSLSVNSQEELVLKFDFFFAGSISSVEFAFTYPYTHEQCRDQMLSLRARYQKDPDILFRGYELCRSVEGRVVDLLVLSSHEGREGWEGVKHDGTFTLGGQRLVKFRSNKPIVFISARVHPIETPSSYVMKGIIQFLLNKSDYRAHLLRKYFVFVLVPMLNPDGVSNGHCRMDSLNQNLNRYYKNPDPARQPACYSVVRLCEHYSRDRRLFMYLDLHAHPANKGNFMFGNAIYDFIEQVESQFFPKAVSQNCVNFEYEQCIFSRKHMSAKDKNEDLNKQGCGRVVFYKEFRLTHAYTLECGYHHNFYNNHLGELSNKAKSYIARATKGPNGQNLFDGYEEQIEEQNDQAVKQYLETLKQQKKKGNKVAQYFAFRCTEDELDNIQSKHYREEPVFYVRSTFENLGRNIMVSILDIWNRNPYTRVSEASEQRRQIAEKVSQLDRFRREQGGIKTKQRKVIQLIEAQCYAQWHKRNIFMQSNYDLRQTQVKGSSLRKASQQRVELSLSCNSRAFGKATSRLKVVSLKEQQSTQTVQSYLESLKSLGQQKPGLAAKLDKSEQVAVYKPLINVRVRNIQLSTAGK